MKTITRKTKRAKGPSRSAKLKEWSRAVRGRDGNKCVVCGATQYIQAHHLLFKKYYRPVSLDINNGLSVCAGCHRFRKLSFHQNPIWSTLWLQEHRPEQYAWCLGQLKGTSEE